MFFEIFDHFFFFFYKYVVMFGSVWSDQLVLHNYCVIISECQKETFMGVKATKCFLNFLTKFLTSMGGWPQRTTGKAAVLFLDMGFILFWSFYMLLSSGGAQIKQCRTRSLVDVVLSRKGCCDTGCCIDPALGSRGARERGALNRHQFKR